MFLKTSIPVVGERIKAGDPLRGPICIIEKIQRVDRIDVENSDIKKWKLMPQDEEYDTKSVPDKDGYDEVLLVPIATDGDMDNVKQIYIVWCNHENKVPTKEEILEKIYGENENEKIQAIVELDFFGGKFQEVADVLNEIDLVRANHGSVLWSAMCVLNNSPQLKDFVDIDKFLEKVDIAIKTIDNVKGEEGFIESVEKFKEKLKLKYSA